MSKFEIAKQKFAQLISQSKSEEDPSHAENVLHWLLELKPDADEVLQLAAFAHDVERSLPDRHQAGNFPSYHEYKKAHAERGGKMASKVLLEAGYSKDDSKRIAKIIEAAEFVSDDPDVQLICDADSISFFDNNAPFYLSSKGPEITRQKMIFMFKRASPRAKQEIEKVLAKHPEIDLIKELDS